jgi:crotonobetainyl-CoA:carnitine CoA-transferase CaiB-like acyl-CoA transferase
VKGEILSSTDEKTGVTIYLAPQPITNSYVKSIHKKLKFPPRFGEHNEEIYCKILGYSSEQLGELKAKGIA